MKRILLLLPLGLILLTGCNSSSGNAELRAKAMCDCMEGIIDFSSLNAVNIEDKFEEAMRKNDNQEKLSKCMLSVFEEISKDLDDLKQDEKKEYTKTLLKAGIDCDCADKMMDLIPYDLLKVGIPKMKKDIERMAEYGRKREYERESEPATEGYYDEMAAATEVAPAAEAPADYPDYEADYSSDYMNEERAAEAAPAMDEY
jgi:hypothetical protein